MKKKQFSLKYLVLLLTTFVAGNSNVFAYELGHLWEFNQNSYNFGRVADDGSLINDGNANADWKKIQYSLEYEQLDDNGNSTTITDNNVWHCFIKHNISNNVIQGGTNSNLNGWNIFNGLLQNITFNVPNKESFGFCNEDEKTGEDCHKRYVVLKQGASFTISNINVGDRIVIQMGTDNSTALLNINNAKDALGTPITENYQLGGSTWFKKGYWSGEYHFIATSNTMTFTVVGGTGRFNFLKLYRVKWYKATTEDEKENGFNPTQNEIVCNDNRKGQTFYHSYKETTPIRGQYELHYRGKGERIKVDRILKSGNLSIGLDKISYDNNDDWGHLKAYYTSVPGEYGIFKIRLVTHNTSHNYVADYAERVCSQTYLNKENYPCTWDFTDLKGYFDEVKSLEQNLDDPGLAFWKQENDAYSFQMAVHTNAIAGHHAQYVNGGEFHLGNHAFPELMGLGVSACDWGGYVHNDNLLITSEGIKIDDEVGPFHFIIPDVPGASNQTKIYVRLGDVDAAKFTAKQKNGNGDDQDMLLVGELSNGEKVYRTYTIQNNADITLKLNGCVVKKIGVSQDFKDVNSYGYSTESRARAIDHSLTPYFSAGNIKAYSVSDVDYDNSKIVLSEVKNILPAASANGDAGLGVILYNTKEGTDKTFSGFGLFVADIHDTETLSGTNLLCANLTNNTTIGQSTGDNVNYLLNAQGTNVVTGETVNGIAFYRASKTAKLGPNKAYLPMLKSAGAKMSMVFIDEEVENNEATGITVVNTKRTEDNAFYTLSGVKVERPTESGIYIRNGKKVIIK